MTKMSPPHRLEWIVGDPDSGEVLTCAEKPAVRAPVDAGAAISHGHEGPAAGSKHRGRNHEQNSPAKTRVRVAH